MVTPPVTSFLERYTAIAGPEKLDALGYYIPPFYYMAGQMIAAAVTATGSTESGPMAD